MKTLYDSVLTIHIACGFAGLVTYWIAASAKKGGPLHLKIGRWFVILMYAVCVTAFITATLTISSPLITHPETADPNKSIEFAEFLFFLGLLTFSTAWNADRAVKEKKDLRGIRGPIDLVVNGVTLVCGIVVAAIGITHHSYLLIVIGILGGPVSTGQHFKFLIELGRRTPTRQAYLSQHIQGMVGSGIALHTAFLAGGAATLYFPWLAQRTGVLFWFVPSVIGPVFQKRVLAKYAPGKPFTSA